MALSARTATARALAQAIIEARNEQYKAAEARFRAALTRARDTFRVEIAAIDQEMRRRLAEALATDENPGEDDPDPGPATSPAGTINPTPDITEQSEQ